ncbi:MAG: DUF2490 domain-containing protein [Gemmatimonadaceae bacterium]|nr:DUF2490 domain-containing protein [Gemmatimonadaceae bacterium]
MARRTAGLCALVATTAAAQVQHNGHLWLNVFGDHRLGDRTALYVELSARRADFAREWQQQVLGLGLARAVGGSYRVTATLIAQRSWPYTGSEGGTAVDELRPWLQLAGQRRVGGAASRWQWADRSRLEMRWQRRDAPFDVEGDWRGSYRFRRQDRFQRALARDWYASLSQEWFLDVPPGGRGPLVDQSRTQLSLGRALSRTLRVEGGYMLQWLERPSGLRELNHTLVVALRSSAPLR